MTDDLEYVRTEPAEGRVLLQLRGRFDGAAARALIATVEQESRRGCRELVVDFSRLVHLSDVGLGRVAVWRPMAAIPVDLAGLPPHGARIVRAFTGEVAA